MVEQQDSAAKISTEQWQDWFNQIAAIGGHNPSLNFERNELVQLDLERVHPTGQTQFLSGRPTPLSNLVRDPAAFTAALAAVRVIKNKGERLSEHFGVDTIHAAGGLLDLASAGFDLQLPVMFWPVRVIGRGSDDFELTLIREPEVNPALIEALREHAGIELNPAELLHRQSLVTDLMPADLVGYLNTLVAPRLQARVESLLVLGNFSAAVSALIQSSSPIETEPLRVLAGVAAATNSDLPLPDAVLVADADSTQRRIVARAVAGESFAVETLPGTGYTQTVVNALAAMANAGKRVLLVAPRRQTLHELADRLAAVGLNGLAVRSTSAWIDAIAAISRNEKSAAREAEVGSARGEQLEQLAAATASIDTYFETLNQPSEKLEVSVAQALAKLSELSLMPNAPVNSARLDRDQLVALRDRTEALELLQKAHELGEFKYGPADTAWFQAQFANAEQVTQALSVARRLRDEAFPKLSQQLGAFTNGVNFVPAVSVEDWGRYLRLFVGLRETLDRFQPVVFDRPLTELIIATGPRKPEQSEFEAYEPQGRMSGGNRRRLKKLAKEYLRPGMTVPDMNAALRAISIQREDWQRFCNVPTPPQVPLGIADAQVAYQSFVADLEHIQQYLDPESTEPPLTKMPLELLERKLESLAGDSEALSNLGDRLQVTDRLRDLGLGRLLRDLARIKVAREHLSQELEQAWWSSALEYLVSKSPQLLGYSSTELARLESEFRTMDAALIAAGSSIVAGQLAKRWSDSIADNKAEAEALKAVLRSGHATIAELAAAAPGVWPHLANAVLASPFELARVLPASEKFDCLFVLDAAGTTVAENLSALSRVRQVIAWGDEAIAGPDGFEFIPSLVAAGLPAERELSAQSIYREVGEAYGIETMRHSWRTTGQALGGLINREFYQNRIVFEPTAAEFLGEQPIILDLIHQGNRATSQVEGATESLDAEVARCVDLVIHHAKWHPQDSLLVSTASAKHAERVREAVQAAIARSADLAMFFEGHGRERFEVMAMADLTHRIADRVVFSVGFGLTEHGALLSNLGQLQLPESRRYLANVLVSSRREITIVSCFDATAMDADKLKNGAVLLRDLLAAATGSVTPTSEFDRDPMLVDLALRLQKLGVRVNGAYAERLPLVCSYAKTAVVIEPDWALRGDSYSERLRLRPALLTALGWRYVRVHSFELFADPQAVANRIAESLGIQVSRSAVIDRRDEIAFEDTDLAWGDHRGDGRGGSGNDQRLIGDKPPHWG